MASPELPLVSVVVPVWNGERYLRESLDSILAQTYPRLEVLVMDDASTDGTPAIVAEYGERVRHVRQTETLGIYANANAGIERARGELVAVYHADDVYLPEIVEREVAYLRAHPEAGAVFCSDIFIDRDGRELGRLVLPPELRGGRPLPYRVILDALLTHKNRFLRCPGAMVRASVHADVGGYRQEQFRNTSDLEMWLRIARSYPIGILEEHLFLYRRGHGSSSERYHRLRTELDRYFTIVDLELEAGGKAVADAGALAAYEAHRAEENLLRALAYYLRGDAAGARTVLGEVGARSLAGSRRVQRGRLLALLAIMRVLTRLPRLAPAAALLAWWRARPRTASVRAISGAAGRR